MNAGEPGPVPHGESSRLLLRCLERSMPAPMLMLDPQGRIPWCNQAARAILRDYPDAAALGAALRGPDGLPLFPAGQMPFAPAGHTERRSATLGPSESPVFAGDLLALPCERDGRLLVFLESSDREPDPVPFDQAMEEQAREVFLTMLGHEAQTPINVILGFSQLLQDRLPAGEKRDIAESIHRSAESLLDLLSDFLATARIDSGFEEPRIETFSLRDLLHREVLPFFQEKAAEKKLTLAFLDNPDIPDALVSDPRHIRQILYNLLANAVRYTREGGVSVCLRKIARKPKQQDYLSIEVMDTGAGIPEALHQKIFRPFFRYPLDDSLHEEGGGIGLSVALRLATRLSGHIHLESKTGEGSTFSLRLPMRATELPGGEPDALPRLLKSGRIENLSILVVEDDASSRKIVLAQLEKLGARAETAGDGREALEHLRRHLTDLVLLDLQLPGIDGLEIARRIRRDLPPERQPAIAALTAHRAADQRKACLEAGMDACFGKPLRKNDLKKMLEQALDSKP